MGGIHMCTCSPTHLRDLCLLRICTRASLTQPCIWYLAVLVPVRGLQAEIELWRAGMKALREAGDHVYVKLSMLCYTDADWDKEGSIVPGLVREVIDLFGTKRYSTALEFSAPDQHSCIPPVHTHSALLMRGFLCVCVCTRAHAHVLCMCVRNGNAPQLHVRQQLPCRQGGQVGSRAAL